MTPADLARSLSEAQKEALLRRPCPSWWDGGPACMPRLERTAFALRRKGLCVGSGTSAWPLTPLGEAVRAELAKER